MWQKQSLTQLSIRYHLSIPTVRSIIDQYQTPTKFPFEHLKPQSVFLAIDAFYRKRGTGILVFRAINLEQNLLWFDIRSEAVFNYTYGVEVLAKAGWDIKGIVIDGRRGVLKTLSLYAPVQHCQFHQIAIVKRYLTSKPQTEAGLELRQLGLTITKTTKTVFTFLLADWYQKWGEFIKEKTIHPSGIKSYTHKRVRSCYFSLKHNLAWLFVYQEIVGLPNTTNSLDGSISHLRSLIRLHRGAKLSLQRKITHELLKGKNPQFFH